MSSLKFVETEEGLNLYLDGEALTWEEAGFVIDEHSFNQILLKDVPQGVPFYMHDFRDAFDLQLIKNEEGVLEIHFTEKYKMDSHSKLSGVVRKKKRMIEADNKLKFDELTEDEPGMVSIHYSMETKPYEIDDEFFDTVYKISEDMIQEVM